MSDWNTTQPVPQGVEPGTKAPMESGEPVVGFSDPACLERVDATIGEAIPPSRRVMH
jgi:hypothetical protein